MNFISTLQFILISKHKFFIFTFAGFIFNLNSYAFVKNSISVKAGNAKHLSVNNAPVFNSSNYAYTVSEEIALTTSVGSVNATDPDGDALTYSIKAGNTISCFAIKTSTGAITVAKKLNHHTQDSYTITVRVTDVGGLSDEATVVIKVQAAATTPSFTNITWNTAASQPYGTWEVHGEAVNGKLYIFGGFDVLKKPAFTPTKRSFVYNPVNNTWARIADLPHTPNGADFGGISHEGLATDGTDIYFAGGYPSNANGTGQVFGTKQVWKYNVASNTYSALPNLPQELAAGQLRYLKGKLHYMGGANKSRRDTAVHYALDLDNLSAGWKILASLPNATNHPGSAVYEGKIYYISGSYGQDNAAIPQKTVQVYDLNTNSWSLAADIPTARDHISSGVTVMGNRIIVLGGETSHTVRSNLVSAYTPATNTWRNLTPLPITSADGVAGVLNGTLYYTGGHFSITNYKGVPVLASATTLLPFADAFVRNGNYSAINYGGDTAFSVKGSASTGYTRTSYLKFSLNNISNVSSAKLRIYGRNIENTQAINISVYGVNNDGWAENTITWNNAPIAATAALSSVAVNDQLKYYELDVTSFVQSQLSGDRIVSLLLKDPSNLNRNLMFNSKENVQNLPQLLIENTGLKTASLSSVLTAPSETSIKTKVYPNPINQTFTVELPKSYTGDINLKIVDPVGRIHDLGKSKLKPGTYSSEIDVSKLSLKAGVYFLRIYSDAKQTEVIKLIVQ